MIRGREPSLDLVEGALHLIDPLTVAWPGQPGVFVLAAHVARAEAELDPAVGEQVGRGGGAREQRRIPEPHVQYVGSKAHPRRDLRGGVQNGERVRSPQMIGGCEHVAAKTLRPPDDIAELRRGGGSPQGNSERQAGHETTLAQPYGCARVVA